MSLLWKNRTSAANIDWNSIVYVNGLFVAVAGSGTGNRIMTSPDGITWTSITSPADNEWLSVTYGNGLFVATAISGSDARVMTSSDGITWTTRSASLVYTSGVTVDLYEGTNFNTFRSTTISPNVNFNATFDTASGGDGNTFSIRATGQIQAYTTGTNTFKARSDDGVRVWINGSQVLNKWIDRAPTTDTFTVSNLIQGNWYDFTLEYYERLQGEIIQLLDANSNVLTSLRTLVYGSWISVTYGNGLFVAVSVTGTGNRVMTSSDGITWTSRISAADNDWQSVTYGNGLFVAVSNTGTGNRVMTSSDGITWTTRTSSADNTWQSVTYGNGLFVAVSSSGTGNRVMTSSDGITWRSRISAADNQWRSVTYGNGLFVAVSRSGTNDRIMSSPDGITWTIQPYSINSNWHGITYGNGIFVAVARTASASNYQVITTTIIPAITFSVPSPKTYGTDFSFIIQDLSSNSPADFSYNSSNTSVATINGGIITIVGAGATTITVKQDVCGNYTDGSENRQLVVNKATASLKNFSIPSKTYREASFAITKPTTTNTDNSNNFTYTSSNTVVATVSGDIISITGAGNTIITATQLTTTNYNSTTIHASFVVNKANPFLDNFNIPTKTYGNPPFIFIAPYSDSPGRFTYHIDPSNIANISDNTITINAAGTAIINATQETTNNYNSSSIGTVFLVEKAYVSLNNFSIPTKTYGDASFTISKPTTTNTDNSNNFTYTSSNTSVATVSGDIITVLTSGNTIITAIDASTANFNSATIDASFVVNKADVSLNNFTVETKTYGDAQFTIKKPSTTNPDNSNNFIYTSSNTNVATVSGDIITIIGAGNTIITATQTTTSNFNFATTNASFVVNKSDVSLNNFIVETKTYGDAPFTITKPSTTNTDNSNNFIYTSSNKNVATVSGDIITILTPGNTTITATQATTSNFNTAFVNTTFMIDKANPYINRFSIPPKTYGDASFIVTDPSSNSSGTFTYSSDASNVVDISGNTITIVGTGTAPITATQSATNNYNSSSIGTIFVVNNANPFLTNFSIPIKTYGDASFNIMDPSSNSSGIFTYSTDASNIADISGNTITIIGGGTAIIKATQSATNNYNKATIYAPFVVNKANATINIFDIPTKTYGNPSFTLTDPYSDNPSAFIYSIDNSNVAYVSGNIITIVGAGIANIRTIQAATDNYNEIIIDTSFVVNKADVSLNNFSIDTKTYGDSSFHITKPTTNNTDTSYNFTYTSSDTNVATVSGDIITILTVGNTIITANQTATRNYNSDMIDASFVVNKADVSLNRFTIDTKTYGDAPFTVKNPTTTNTDNSNNFTYTSSNTNIATVSGDIITIITAGNTIITATQDPTYNFNLGSIDTSFVVNKANPSLMNFSIPIKTYGEASFNIIDPSTNSPGAFTYTTNDSNIADISGNTITIMGAGTTTITATQATTNNYISDTINTSIVVNKANPFLTNFSIPSTTYGNIPFTITDPSSNSPGTFTYSSDASNVVDISGNTITIIGTGTAIITAVQSATNNYNQSTTYASFVVNPAIQFLSNFSIPSKTYGNPPFIIRRPTSISPGIFTYSSDDSNVADISGDIITIVGAGTAIITATQAATNNYISDTINTYFIVNKATTTLTNFNIPHKTYGDSPFNLIDPSSNSQGAFTYITDASNVADISGNIITIVGAGIATITANQAYTNNYLPNSATASLIVNKATPTISFNAINKRYGNAAFIPSIFSDSIGTFTYSSSNTNVATISDNTITIVGVGTSIITANQSEVDNYVSKTVTASLVVDKAIPTIVFNDIVKTYENISFIPDITSNSNGDFRYIISNPYVATGGDNITITGVGSSLISAIQSEVDNYYSKTVNATLVVNKGIPTIMFDTIVKTVQDDPFIPNISSNSDGAFTYTSSNTNVAIINDNIITIIKEGISTITANQEATGNYVQGTASTTLTVNRKFQIIPENGITKTYGDNPFIPSIFSNNNPFTCSSSNTDVAITNGDIITIIRAGTTTITGTQIISGNYIYKNVILTVNRNTTFYFIYPETIIFDTTHYNSYKPRAPNVKNSNTTINYNTVTPLPDGIKFNKNTGELYGIPTTTFGKLSVYIVSNSNNYSTYRSDITLICNDSSDAQVMDAQVMDAQVMDAPVANSRIYRRRGRVRMS
jgi:hypothetical protein